MMPGERLDRGRIVAGGPLGAMILLSEEEVLVAMGTDFTGWWAARMGGNRPFSEIQDSTHW
ncbi:hypothetical protein JKG47_07840 [Acidithiobacillus sp. MC6.1]|nr:hypothetical protein [Acidithiobacillus sp. MC6.1]